MTIEDIINTIKSGVESAGYKVDIEDVVTIGGSVITAMEDITARYPTKAVSFHIDENIYFVPNRDKTKTIVLLTADIVNESDNSLRLYIPVSDNGELLENSSKSGRLDLPESITSALKELSEQNQENLVIIKQWGEKMI